MGHSPAVGHGIVFSGPQSSTRMQHQHSLITSLCSLCFLVEVVGPPSYFIILVSPEQKKLKNPGVIHSQTTARYKCQS